VAPGIATKPRTAATLVVLAALGVVFALAGCGARAPRPAALRVERTDLVLLGRTLQGLEGKIHAEVAAARSVWPTLAHGLPATMTPATRRGIAAAAARAGALVLPTFVTIEAGLTGPAAGIGGLLKHYAILTRRGWRFIAAATAGVGTGPTGGLGPTGASGSRHTSSTGTSAADGAGFLRANAGLYIYCVYDGHYDLSLVGKAIVAAYEKLGGSAAFGAELTAAHVAALTRAYSIPAVRLAPHPAPGVQV
jgi:hypothetical protein